MKSSRTAPTDVGRAALARGDWEGAKLAFEQSIAHEESAEAFEGLGLAAWWLDHAQLVFEAREHAYRIYRARGDRADAARVAVWLAWDSAAFRGEHAIASGWLQRARRLLADHEPCPEHAWLALRSGVFALLDDGDPADAEKFAFDTMRLAQETGATDYEVAGRALRGFAQITAGKVAEGLRDLDEVSAAVLAGEVTDFVLMGLSCCYLIAACDRIRDYDRAAQWCDRLKEYTKKWGLVPLFAVCRTQYASVCIWRGAWDEAEKELAAATVELAASRPAMTGEGLVRLGELRRRQGRLDAALSLFDQAGGHPLAALGRAAIALDRGDFQSAADLAERCLRKLPAQNRTERAAVLELLVRAHAELMNGAEADEALRELVGIAEQAQTDPLRGSANLASGILATGKGDHASARRHLEDAVDLFQRSGAPFEMARARLALAVALDRLGRASAAEEEARRAIEEFRVLRADLELSQATNLLQRLGAQAAPTESREGRGGLTTRELEVLRLISTGLSNQAIAERLFISEHTVHRHVANTLTKLNVSSRSAAVAHVARLGLL